MKKQTRGIIDAIISSSTFGFSPFFSVSLLAMGLGTLDVLSYRWGIATLVLLLIAIWTKKSVSAEYCRNHHDSDHCYNSGDIPEQAKGMSCQR